MPAALEILLNPVTGHQVYLGIKKRGINMKYKVFLLKDVAQSGKDYLKEHDCDVVIAASEDEDEIIKQAQGCHGIFVRNENVTARMMDGIPTLKVIAKHGVGYDNIDIEAATKRNIQVVYAPLGNVNSVAEHALLLLLACARKYTIASDELKSGNYAIRFSLSGAHEIKGKTLGLLGYGHIAKCFAKKAKNGLEMNVISYTRSSKPGINEDGVEMVENRDDLFKRADYLSIHVPSTPETRHSIGMREFMLMKKGACIINTARGNIINEAELVEALNKGIIAGAGLDVLEKEPVDKDNPLLKMEQVVVTPHVAGMTVEASDALSLTGAKGIVETLYGLPITYPVNTIKR